MARLKGFITSVNNKIQSPSFQRFWQGAKVIICAIGIFLFFSFEGAELRSLGEEISIATWRAVFVIRKNVNGFFYLAAVVGMCWLLNNLQRITQKRRTLLQNILITVASMFIRISPCLALVVKPMITHFSMMGAAINYLFSQSILLIAFSIILLRVIYKNDNSPHENA